jgi:hypothetical protein
MLPALLRRLAAILDGAQLQWMVTGSLASTLYGEARSTQDIDLVVVLSRTQLAALLASLPEEQYYVSWEAAREAWRRNSQFNIIDMETGWKVDLILCKARPFSQQELARRQRCLLMGVPVPVCTAEDSLLSKLEWAERAGGSARQLRDAAAIIGARGAMLDRAYVEAWAVELGVEATWRRLWAEHASASSPPSDPEGDRG